jgi:hypothetical protein
LKSLIPIEDHSIVSDFLSCNENQKLIEETNQRERERERKRGIKEKAKERTFSVDGLDDESDEISLSSDRNGVFIGIHS